MAAPFVQPFSQSCLYICMFVFFYFHWISLLSLKVMMSLVLLSVPICCSIQPRREQAWICVACLFFWCMFVCLYIDDCKKTVIPVTYSYLIVMNQEISNFKRLFCWVWLWERKKLKFSCAQLDLHYVFAWTN